MRDSKKYNPFAFSHQPLIPSRGKLLRVALLRDNPFRKPILLQKIAFCYMYSYLCNIKCVIDDNVVKGTEYEQ